MASPTAPPPTADHEAGERRSLLSDPAPSASAAQPQYLATASATAAGAGGGSSAAPPEQQDRRVSGGGGADRQQFEASRQENVRTALLSRDSWGSPLAALVLFLGVLLLLAPPIIIFYIEIRSWHTLIVYGAKPCDQDLAFWLLIRNMMTLLAPRMPAPGELDEQEAERQRACARWFAALATVWLVVGYIWTQNCTECQKTNPQLFEWVRFLTLFGLFLHFLQIFFPLLIFLCAAAYHGMVARGWIKSPNAASENAIENMREVPFSASVFGPGAAPVEGRDPPPAECCCCMDEFGPEKNIVSTPCFHYFHKECLKEWLKLSKTCPLCRSNLDVDHPV